MKNPKILFYVQREEAVAGPYDLVQLAGLLRKQIITPETMTSREGRDDWQPLSWQPQYSIVREMSPDAVSTRVDALEEEALAAQAGPIMLPSRETVMKLVALGIGTVLAGIVSFVLACLSASVGYCLLIGGITAVAVATCMMYVRMLDENMGTLLSIYFIPFYDVYFLLTNIWRYFDLFCVKYVGTGVAIGAAIGLKLGSHSV